MKLRCIGKSYGMMIDSNDQSWDFAIAMQNKSERLCEYYIIANDNNIDGVN